MLVLPKTPKNPRRVAIGYGNAAKIQENSYPESKTVGIIDTDPSKIMLAQSQYVPFFSSVEKVVKIKDKLKPDYYSICTPTRTHVDILENILRSDENANVLIEKPVCHPSQIERLSELTKEFNKSKLVVNENYMSSFVTEEINELAKRYKVRKPEITIEFSKNRIPDVANGRFVDEQLFSMGYEGSHELAVVNSLGGKDMRNIQESELFVMKLPNGAVKKNQGGFKLAYDTQDGSNVNVLSSMTGKILSKIPKINRDKYYTDLENPSEKYRTVMIESGPTKVIGRFEPVSGMQGNMGILGVFDKTRLEEGFIVNDNSMKQSQENAMRFFYDEGQNPCTVDQGINVVKELDRAVKAALG